MAFFNEFPHTRTYDSDLAWLIKRMKEVLSRMDSVEARMQAVEDLVNNFIETLNLPQVIKDYIIQIIAEGGFDDLISFKSVSIGSGNGLVVPIDYTGDTAGKAAKCDIKDQIAFITSKWVILTFTTKPLQYFSPYSATDIFGFGLGDVTQLIGAENPEEYYNFLVNSGYGVYDTEAYRDKITIDGVGSEGSAKLSTSISVTSAEIVLRVALGSVVSQTSDNYKHGHMVIIPRRIVPSTP